MLMSRLTIHTYSPNQWAAFLSHAEQLGVALSDESGRPSWPPRDDRVQAAREAMQPGTKDPALQRRVDAAKRAISGGSDDEVKARAKETSAAMSGTVDPAVKKRADQVRKAMGR